MNDIETSLIILEARHELAKKYNNISQVIKFEDNINGLKFAMMNYKSKITLSFDRYGSI